mmetsp:Transcript_18550/g.49801  ORF Transcript_18550/g.49801 Transcript_18550/m.49801 type:complete len:252 (+) Transcript_18550:467-1222(+)
MNLVVIEREHTLRACAAKCPSSLRAFPSRTRTEVTLTNDRLQSLTVGQLWAEKQPASVDGREGAVRQIKFVVVRAEEWVLQVNEFVKGAEEHHVAIQNQHAIVVHELRRVELQVLHLSAATLQHLRPSEGVLDFLEWHEGWPRQDGEAEISKRISVILRQGIWHDGQEVNGVRTFLGSLPCCVSKNHESIMPIRLTLDSVGNSSGDGQCFPLFPSTRPQTCSSHKTNQRHHVHETNEAHREQLYSFVRQTT